MLLFYLTPPQYSNATSALCKSLILLGSKKRAAQDPSFTIDFTQQGSAAHAHTAHTLLHACTHIRSHILTEVGSNPGH